MYQVINLGSLANDSAVNGSTVDTGIVADFHIILQHYITGLQHLAVLAVLGNIAKAVAADYRTGLQNNSVTKYTVLTDSSIRIKGTILAHFYALADISMRIDYAAVADFCIILNNSKGLNSNIAADFCLLGYISIRTDNTLNFFLRTEQLQQCGKGCTRVGNSDNRASVKLRILGTENHYAGLAEMTVLYMRRHRKGNILRSCLNQSVNAGNAQFGVIMLYRAF